MQKTPSARGKTHDNHTKKAAQEVFAKNFDPETDHRIASNFSLKTLVKRVKNKEVLQQKSGLKNAKNKLVLAVFLPFLKDESLEYLNDLWEGLRVLDVQIVILREGHEGNLKIPHGSQGAVLEASLENLHQVLAGADLFLFPAELKRRVYAISLALKYGAVPLLPQSETLNGLISDYDPVSENGVAFVYENGSIWSMFAGIIRAMETYKLPYDWHGIQRNGMSLDLTSLL
jgi:starch synthase